MMYRNSKAGAKRLGELQLWREEQAVNRACAAAIKDAISTYHDGMYLSDGCVGEVVSVYGYDRTMWVLAATIKYKDYDGRFSQDNRRWADGILPSYFEREEYERYVCEAHPAILNGFIGMVRRAYEMQQNPEETEEITEEQGEQSPC